MKVRIFHNGQEIEMSEWDETTPDEVKKWHQRYQHIHGYDVMIGATCYDIKSSKWANNKTEVHVKVRRT